MQVTPKYAKDIQVGDKLIIWKGAHVPECAIWTVSAIHDAHAQDLIRIDCELDTLNVLLVKVLFPKLTDLLFVLTDQ